MLILSRKEGESIRLSDDIEVAVVAVDGQRVRLGIKAPRHVKVVRSELLEQAESANQQAVTKFSTGELSPLAKAALAAKQAKSSE